VLPLEAEGPNFAVEGTVTKYRDVIEVKSDDHWAMTSYMLNDQGTWQELMTMNYRRNR
jgi:hypothetical protein